MECLDHSTVISQLGYEEVEVWAEDEEMAKISPADWKTIEGKIAKAITAAIEPLKNSPSRLGWRKAGDTLKEYAPLGGIFTLVLGLLAIIVTLGIGVSNRREQDARFQTRTDDRLTQIEGSLLALRISQVVANPATEKSWNEARNILAVARKGSAQIPVSAVEQAGKSFIEVAQTEPRAWGVALDFVAYRSALNTSQQSVLDIWNKWVLKGEAEPKPVDLHNVPYNIYNISPLSGHPDPNIWGSGEMIPIKDGTHYQNIGESTRTSATSPSWLFISNGTISLDGKDIQNVMFRRSEIHYSGKPVLLKNVVFIDCTFVLDNTALGRDLAQQMLTDTRVSFSPGA